MKRWITRLAVVGLLAGTAMPMTAAPASAMTCIINDGDHTDPDIGDTACEVFLTVIRPVCSKFECG